MREMVERVDEHDRVLGIADRETVVRRGWIHRSAGTICWDRKGRILICQRPYEQRRFPGRHQIFIGGAVGVGETYEAAARRELSEELGIAADLTYVTKTLVHGEIHPYWLSVYETRLDQRLRPDPAEVLATRWVTVAELRDALHAWPFRADDRSSLAQYLLATVGEHLVGPGPGAG
ncbi:NUDIX domain-containing protein (plasmid) [Streptomyces sp. BI20]|uniref:NUDIX domain-containing protein n=1 Tax=Streptomyces sp. BI20 TaxID=3403460 RepID=UPI003C70C845